MNRYRLLPVLLAKLVLRAAWPSNPQIFQISLISVFLGRLSTNRLTDVDVRYKLVEPA